MKRTATVVWVILWLALLSGCVSASQPATSQRVLNVGMLLAQGGLGDRSFNDSAYTGLQEAQKQPGVRFETVDYISDEANLEALCRFARQEYDLIIEVGFENGATIETVAKEFPNRNFAIIDTVAEGNNVASIVYREQEGDFLMGVLAAMLTQSKKVGFIGGMDISIIQLWWGKKLRRRLLALSIITTLFFLILLGTLSIRTGQAGIREGVSLRNGQLAALVARDTNAYFNNIWGNVRLFTYQLEASPVMLPVQARAMLEFRRASPLTYRALYLFDGEGRLLIHLADPPEDLLAIREVAQITDRPPIPLTDELSTAYQAAKGGDLYLSATHVVGTDQVPIVYMGIPLGVEGDWRAGQVVVAEIDLRDIWRRIDEIHVEQTGRAFVVSREGIVIAHPERAYIGRPIGPGLRQVLAGYEGQTEYADPISGRLMLASYSPVGAIKNAAYFLNKLMTDCGPEVKEMLEIVEKEVATSSRIANSLLEFTRVGPPVRRQVDLNQVIREALSRTVVPEHIKVECQLDQSLSSIRADPVQLDKVFGNLFLNAIQAMSPPYAEGNGGQLVVKTSVYQTSEVSDKLPKSTARSGWVTISVADSGVGIPEENLGKLFEPLFTTKAKGIGLGLGLALAKMLVEGHGGTIRVESHGVPGKGSTFTVRLPRG